MSQISDYDTVCDC